MLESMLTNVLTMPLLVSIVSFHGALSSEYSWKRALAIVNIEIESDESLEIKSWHHLPQSQPSFRI